MNQQEITKVCIWKQETQETLYPQIVRFVFQECEKVIVIQGLQSVYSTMVHFEGSGIITVCVQKNETIRFEFGNNTEYGNDGWVTADIIPIFQGE